MARGRRQSTGVSPELERTVTTLEEGWLPAGYRWKAQNDLPRTAGHFCKYLIQNAFRAGDRTRTGDVQLGKLAFYQLNYARVEP